MEPAAANTTAKKSNLARILSKSTPLNMPKVEAAALAQRTKIAEYLVRRNRTDVLAKLPHEALMQMPDEILNELPPSILAKFPPERLARLPYTTLITLLDPLILPATVVAAFPPDVLETLSPSVLLQLPPEARLMLPPRIQEALEKLAGRVSLVQNTARAAESERVSATRPAPSEEPGVRFFTVQPLARAAASQVPAAEPDGKLYSLPMRTLDARRGSHGYSGGQQPGLERSASQPSYTQSRGYQKRQPIKSWLESTVSTAGNQSPSEHHDTASILRELADLRVERDALVAEKAKMKEKLGQWESYLGSCKMQVREQWGEYWTRINATGDDRDVVLKTLVFARGLVAEYRDGLDACKRELKEEIGRNKEKEAVIQELQAELAPLRVTAQERVPGMEDELARLKLAHKEELDGARKPLLEQLQKLQKFGRELQQKGKAAAEEHKRELARREADLEAQHRDEMKKLVQKSKQQRGEEDEAKHAALIKIKHNHKAEVDSLRAHHTEEIAQLARMHEEQLAAQSKLAQQREDELHEEKMTKLERMNKAQLATEAQLRKEQEENELLQRERAMLHASIQQLQVDTALQLSQQHDEMSSLSSQKGQLRQTVDGNLRRLFQRLQFAIEVVTEPVNLGEISLVPGSQLDRDGFVERNGEGALRFLLKHIVWSVIINGFFSAPFGFGIFGDGEARDRLFQLYVTWRRLVAPDHETTGSQDGANSQPPTLDFGIFFQDPEANRWRSSTFASIRSSTVNPAMVANSEKVGREIHGLLSAVTTTVPEEITNKVDEIVSLAGEMALETGIHESHLGLLMPAPGTSTQIGQEFIDCEDEYTVSRTVESVELGVCPYFYRVGDGTSDFSTTWVIARGKVYIKRSP